MSEFKSINIKSIELKNDWGTLEPWYDPNMTLTLRELVQAPPPRRVLTEFHRKMSLPMATCKPWFTVLMSQTQLLLEVNLLRGHTSSCFCTRADNGWWMDVPQRNNRLHPSSWPPEASVKTCTETGWARESDEPENVTVAEDQGFSWASPLFIWISRYQRIEVVFYLDVCVVLQRDDGALAEVSQVLLWLEIWGTEVWKRLKYNKFTVKTVVLIP